MFGRVDYSSPNFSVPHHRETQARTKRRNKANHSRRGRDQSELSGDEHDRQRVSGVFWCLPLRRAARVGSGRRDAAYRGTASPQRLRRRADRVSDVGDTHGTVLLRRKRGDDRSSRRRHRRVLLQRVRRQRMPIPQPLLLRRGRDHVGTTGRYERVENQPEFEDRVSDAFQRCQTVFRRHVSVRESVQVASSNVGLTEKPASAHGHLEVLDHNRLPLQNMVFCDFSDCAAIVVGIFSCEGIQIDFFSKKRKNRVREYNIRQNVLSGWSSVVKLIGSFLLIAIHLISDFVSILVITFWSF